MIIHTNYFDSLSKGTSCLVSRLGATFAIASLGALLAAFAISLQIYFDLPDDPAVDNLIVFVSVLPLDLYFIPRFLIRLNNQLNHNDKTIESDEWRQQFEERWLRVFITKTLLAIIIGIGLCMLVLPGVIIIVLFSWSPLCVLLRGESILQAAKSSMAIMGLAWRKIIIVTIAMSIVCLLVAIVTTFCVNFFLGEPTAKLRLMHPAIWVSNFVGSLLGLWFSTCLLILYRSVELKHKYS